MSDGCKDFYVLSQERKGLQRKRIIRGRNRFEVWNDAKKHFIGEKIIDVWETKNQR